MNIMYVTVDQLLVIIGDGHPTFNRESPMEIVGCLDPTSSTYQSMGFLGRYLYIVLFQRNGVLTFEIPNLLMPTWKFYENFAVNY